MESTLPKKVYVRQADDEGLLEAFGSFGEAVEEDGPTEIGEYELVQTKTFEKIAQEVEQDPDRPKT